MVWVTVADFPDFEVSEDGRIRHRLTGEPVKWIPHSGGYWTVRFPGERAPVLVHRVVAAAFLGPVPPDHEVDHIDNDRGNPHFSNLRYVTHAENMRASSERMETCRSGRHPWIPGKSTYTEANGHNKCRACVLERMKVSYQAKKERNRGFRITRAAVSVVKNRSGRADANAGLETLLAANMETMDIRDWPAGIGYGN